MNSIAAVIVTYNRKEKLKECIQYVLRQKGYSCDVMIIDNASNDHTGEMVSVLMQLHQNIQYYNTGANLGGAGGFQYGIRKAAESGYEYIWIMDDDAYPRADALYWLMKANDKLKGRYGFLSSSVLWKDGTTCVMNRQLLHQKMHDFIESPDPGVKRIDQATFVSLLFPASVIKKVGLPIKEYFIWGDDVEFTRRIAVIHKYPCFYIGKSRVVHMMNNNAGSSIAFDDIARLDRYVYAFRNDGCTYRREGMKGRIWYIGKCGINACRILAKSKDHKRERLGTLIQGMKESAKFHPAIEYI